MKILSFSFIISIAFLGYVGNTIWTIADMFVPPVCQKGEQCLHSYLTNRPRQKLLFFSSCYEKPSSGDVEKVHEIQDFDYDTIFATLIDLKIPRRTRRNGTMYLHIAMVDREKSHLDWKSIQYSEPLQTIPLTVYAVPQAATFNLINNQGQSDKDAKQKKESSSLPVTHLKSRITFSVLTDRVVIPVNRIPNELYPLLRMATGNKYRPILQYNLLKTRLKEFIEVTTKTSSVNLTVEYLPISFGKLRLLQHLKIALQTLSQMGFSEKELDDVKGIFADTNLYLLCATTFIASFHLLFDFLAFKNDVSFWHKKKSMAGLSMRTVLWRAFSQTIIMLYLFDENTSMIVLVPASIGTLIEMWKVNKVLKIEIKWARYLPKVILRKDLYSEAEMKTHAVDAEAMRYLSYLLYPLCICGAVYSLIYEPHRSWYSWSLHSLVNGVYAFGFLFMLPQLFVNYKLKSVAALPWRAFMYKAFNTFIDDVFAFIITMPTAHRVACFRDDIVFLVYLYQRWLYPVDKSRSDGGVSMDEPQEEIVETKKEK